MVYIKSDPPVDGKKVKNIWWDTNKQELVFDIEDYVPWRDDTLEVSDITDYENIPIRRLANAIAGILGINVGILNSVYGI